MRGGRGGLRVVIGDAADNGDETRMGLVRGKLSSVTGEGLIAFAAGAFAGLASKTMTAPLDRLKVLLQAEGHTTMPQVELSPWLSSWFPRATHYLQRSRIVQVSVRTYQDGGLRAGWQGNGANIVKSMPESAIRFGVFECMKPLVSDWDHPLLGRLFAGSIAGICSQFAVYPLDVTKTRLVLANKGDYGGMWDCFVKTQKAEGWRGMYRGCGVAVVGIIPAASFDLGTYFSLKPWYLEWKGLAEEDMPIGPSLVIGAISGTVGGVVAYPLTVVRTKLIAQGMPGRPTYDGPFDVLWQTVRREGVRGLYAGLVPSLLKTIPAVSIGYGSFEAAKRVGTNVAEYWTRRA